MCIKIKIVDFGLVYALSTGIEPVTLWLTAIRYYQLSYESLDAVFIILKLNYKLLLEDYLAVRGFDPRTSRPSALPLRQTAKKNNIYIRLCVTLRCVTLGCT